MRVVAPKPKYRTGGTWTRPVFSYDLEERLNIQRLKSLRTHPDREDHLVMATRIEKICKDRDPNHWSDEEVRVFSNLFGNRRPGVGFALTMAIHSMKDQSLSAKLSELLRGSSLGGRRGDYARVHGKNLASMMNLRGSRLYRHTLN